MRIAEKLALSARPGKIVFFREGIFLRLYNHSLMRWATVGQPLKVSARPMRCLQGECCYSGGMPEASWVARYRVGGVSLPGGSARVDSWQETPWGYEGEVDDEEPDWAAFCEAHAVSPSVVPPATALPVPVVDEVLMMQLAQWDVWRAPLAHTIQLLEDCRQVLCSPAVSVKSPSRQ